MKEKLSVIVIVYNMRREMPRTLYTLTTPYQRDVSVDDYEVLVIENGSHSPLSPDLAASFGPNFRYFNMPDPKPSPASAVNYGVSLARGKYVGIIIDGARMLSPGILRHALTGFRAFKNPFIYTLGQHLGDDIQYKSMARGYNRDVEDELLKKVDWKENGYRLFEISAFAGNSAKGWFLNSNESNCVFLEKESFIKIGGYDERFDKPGGGMCNHDFFKRACQMPGSDLVAILGEGTFHQMHNGVATNNPDFGKKEILREYKDQYAAIKGEPFSTPLKPIHYIGFIPPECTGDIIRSAAALEEKHRKETGKSQPKGENLGLNLRPGDKHYRAYVGPPRNYDLIAAMTFNLLTTLGLRQHHSVLDVGCGSLRSGRLLIPYLNAGKYTGFEPNEWLVREGIANEIGEDMIRIKEPVFYFKENPADLKKELSFDFAFAQSIFSHCTLELIQRWLIELFSRLQPDGVFLATFVKDEKDFFNKKGVHREDFHGEGWVYPKVVSFRPETLEDLAGKTGFRFRLLDWAHPRQTWALFAKPGFDCSWFENRTLTWNTAMAFCPSMVIPPQKKPGKKGKAGKESHNG